jgi:hypothetical protein
MTPIKNFLVQTILTIDIKWHQNKKEAPGQNQVHRSRNTKIFWTKKTKQIGQKKL